MLQNNPMTLTARLTQVVQENPDKLAMQMKVGGQYKHYTFQQFLDRAQSIAAFLMNLSIQKNDCIAIALKNMPEWGMIYFGISFTGATAVPFDWQSKKEDVLYFLNHSKSKIIFITDELATRVETLFEQCRALEKIILVGERDLAIESRYQKCVIRFTDIPLSTASDFHDRSHAITPDDIASILYTSGTTGLPKGVMLSHHNFCSNVDSVEQVGILTDHESILSILPLHHSFPFTLTLLTPLFTKNLITYLNSLTSTDIFQCLQEARITILAGVPQLFYLLHKGMTEQLKKLPFIVRLPLHSLISMTYELRKWTHVNLGKLLLKKVHRHFGSQFKYLVSGGARLDPNVKRFFNQLGFSFIEGYGLTETSPAVTFNISISRYLDSVGKAVPGVKLRINQPNDQGIGEVCIQGDNVMKGYYQMPKETQAVMHQGWFHSGDLGWLNDAGYLFLAGRQNELIVLSSGKNIAPEEIETHYLQSPFLKELCILSMTIDNEETLMAVIVPNLTYLHTHRAANVVGSVRFAVENYSKTLPPYKRIMGFVLTKEDLPRTRLGKLKRHEIRKQYEQALLHRETHSAESINHYPEADQILMNSSFFRNIITVILEQKPTLKLIQLDDHLEIDLGLDSLGRVELLSKLEESFHIAIDKSLMEKIFTVRDLTLAIENALQKNDSNFVATPKSWHEILLAPLSPDVVDTVDLAPYGRRPFILKCIHHFLYALLRTFWRLKVKGVNNLSKTAPMIFCPNHTSYLDAPIVGSSIPYAILKNTYFIGFSDYFEKSFLKHTAKVCKVISIDPGARLIDALQVAAHILKAGKNICIFPEGERSIDGNVKIFKKGVGILAKELNVALVPVFIQGSYEAWPRTENFPKLHPVKLLFGKPYSPQELIGSRKSKIHAHDDYEAITLAIRDKVIELSQS